jgi:KRAB domain-containing zinc finger protein
VLNKFVQKTEKSPSFIKNSVKTGQINLPLEKQLEIKESKPTRMAPTSSKSKAKCDVCAKSYYCKRDLKRHVETVHENKKPHKCDLCGSSFGLLGALKSHIKSVHKDSETSHKCKVCDKTFGLLSNLKRHVVTVHNIKKFACDQCPIAFIDRPSLHEHIQMVHEKMNPHNCNICGLSFWKLSNVARHLKTVHKNVSSRKRF